MKKMGTLVWKKRERLVAGRKERLAVVNGARKQERAVVLIPNWNERSSVAAKKRERLAVVRKIQRAVGTVRTRS